MSPIKIVYIASAITKIPIMIIKVIGTNVALKEKTIVKGMIVIIGMIYFKSFVKIKVRIEKYINRNILHRIKTEISYIELKPILKRILLKPKLHIFLLNIYCP